MTKAKLIIPLNDTEPLKARFGRRVVLVRKFREMAQKDLAIVSGLDRSYLSSIENGRQVPSILIADRIAKAFDMTLAELLVDL